MNRLGATADTLVEAASFFGTQHVQLDPRSVVSTGERVETHAATVAHRGLRGVTWELGFIHIDNYRRALAVLASAPGTGTVSGTIGETTLSGTGTAFNTELRVEDVLAIHTGGGAYEVVTVAAITDHDTLTVTPALSQTLTNLTFRYRRWNRYSGECYVEVRNELDFYQVWRCVSTFPDPTTSERAARRYLNVKIGLTLIEAVV